MKTIRCLFSALLTVFFFVNVEAQTRFGVKGGVNFANMNIGSGLPTSDLTSFQLGVMADISFAKRFFFQPNLLINGKGLKLKSLTLAPGLVSPELSINPIYIEIPLNLGFRFEIANKVRLYGMAGPYFAWGFAGNTKIGSKSEHINWGSEEDKDLKVSDFGLNIGAGIEMNNFLLGVQWELGSRNVLPNSTTYPIGGKNKVFGISVGYFFDKK